ncbi:unnamed protein product [marine sediment metagenome]|uniref:DZANK-type domain-containing protein n=1 Tax=marine sediment metagenome TaxID=412755 RepID=X1FEH6_9ZZZZ
MNQEVEEVFTGYISTHWGKYITTTKPTTKKIYHDLGTITCYLCNQTSTIEEWDKDSQENLKILKRCPKCWDWLNSELLFCFKCRLLDKEILKCYDKETQKQMKIEIKADKEKAFMVYKIYYEQENLRREEQEKQKELENNCLFCGGIIEENEKYCRNCGAKL